MYVSVLEVWFWFDSTAGFCHFGRVQNVFSNIDVVTQLTFLSLVAEATCVWCELNWVEESLFPSRRNPILCVIQELAFCREDVYLPGKERSCWSQVRLLLKQRKRLNSNPTAVASFLFPEHQLHTHSNDCGLFKGLFWFITTWKHNLMFIIKHCTNQVNGWDLGTWHHWPEVTAHYKLIRATFTFSKALQSWE